MDSGLRIGVLGPLEVAVDGVVADLGGPKQRAVLGVLVALAPEAVLVERLVDEVWGSGGPANPLRSLQVYVSALRSALGPYGDRLLNEGRAYRLDLSGVEVDALRFDELVASALAEPDPAAALTEVDEALCLWRGDAWSGLDVPVVVPRAVALAERRLAALAARARAMLALGRHREAVPWLEQVVHDHPLHEELRGHLMLALHRCHRQAEALAVYTAGRDLKATETGLDPGSDLQALQAAILADDPALRAEDVELRARRHLPAQVTRLLGRDDDVTGLVDLLRDPEQRLATITGPGGIGKTRVGIAVAHRLAADHPDGVWFVGLDALRDPRLVARAVADAVGVEEVAGDVVVPLKEHFASRVALLLLDNFEQVDDAAPFVAELLAAAPGLRVLVTSRVRLRLYGEHVRVLDPLPMDDAIRLFVERARSADHRFPDAPTAELEELCDHLDRLPLALELVAARAGEHPVGTMLAQLRARQALDLAADGPRDRTARQQTLRDAIAWSVDLLPPDLADRFARLGAFAGGFDADAAEAVAGATAADIETLARVNLLEPRPGAGFRLLETVREYAAERLAGDRGAEDEALDRHAAWFHDLAAASVGGLRGNQHRAWRGRLDRERANCRLALERLAAAADRDDPPGVRLLRTAAALGLYWYRTGPGSEDTEWLPRALALAPDAPPEIRGQAEYALAICLGEQGRAELAHEHSRAAYELLRDSVDRSWAARALNTYAGITRDIGRAEEAAALMDEAIAMRRSLDGALGVTVALANRAMTALDLGDVDRARECLEECLRTEGEDELEVALAQAGLADVELAAGLPDAAADRLRASVDVLVAHGQDYRLIECLETFAALAVQRGAADLAATLVAAADRALADEGAVQVPADATIRERRTGAAIRALDPGIRAAAEARGAELDLPAAVALARQRLL
ncbi:putative ATPase/DNA-binding SARP family transcriptional activator [Nocardioides thalensis]|uniref:Putative ATPase/DNA-binding SARP family transcriptional activator n=1 Tax=Nocardioides thalensis TaxID=1914755 RepID=A0A853C9M4_9ACTN|nr:BTAD domain-containing putative transcriptional regulator [Nocardioides thalensis]NYJ03716.1 putative ATPase/DNA-binding SARP family transcriptional activator [Nocardioides thalensis]